MLSQILALFSAAYMFFVTMQPSLLPETRGYSGPVQAGTSMPADKHGVWPTKGDFPEGNRPWWLMPNLLKAVYGIRAYRNDRGTKTNSMLVLYKGKIVYEEYSGSALNPFLVEGTGTGRDALRQMASGGKSFLSALVGIAIAEGHIKGVDQKVIDFFPDAKIPKGQESKRDMTVGHLLTMTSGLPGMNDPGGMDYVYASIFEPEMQEIIEQAFEEAYSLGYLKALRTDTARTLFESSPQQSSPGRAYSYSPQGTDVLAGLVSRAVGMPYEEYAKRKLFAPIGIAKYDWMKLADGTAMGAGGLSLRSRDMLKFGWLYLNYGRWDNRQVVPAAWVAQSSPRGVTPQGYGRLFWNVPFAPISGYGANGAGGQYIDIFPRWDLVIVRTGESRIDSFMRELVASMPEMPDEGMALAG